MRKTFFTSSLMLHLHNLARNQLLDFYLSTPTLAPDAQKAIVELVAQTQMNMAARLTRMINRGGIRA